jgi:hypothetical protein
MTHESEFGENNAFLTRTECRLDISDSVGVTCSRSWTILAKNRIDKLAETVRLQRVLTVGTPKYLYFNRRMRREMLSLPQCLRQ